MCAGLLSLWLLIMLAAQPPRLLDTRVLRFDGLAARENMISSELAAIEGVDEVIVMAEQGVVYLKIDAELLDPGALDKYETAAGN
jgi:hypothetical protein